MLRVRWLGRVPYREALAVQTALFRHGREDHLLLLEHPHVFTHGRRADLSANLRCEPAAVGAELVAVDRGGDITYHGPGQLVGYPILSVDNALGAAAHVADIEQVLIDSLAEIGVTAGRLREYPGVWVGADGPEPRKIAAIGVRLRHGRTMHGFALNVDPDMDYLRRHIVPCGIADRPVTSLREELASAQRDVSLADVADVVARLAARRWSNGEIERQDIAWKHRPDDLSAFSRGMGPGEPVRMTSRLASAGVTAGLAIESRKPEWLRPKVHHGPEVLTLKRLIRSLDLVTVCEDAGCPNLSECWSDGTATFMALGERCTRACGFCLVDTHKPEAPASDEPERIASAVVTMSLDHVVVTMVARDDLADGGMAHMAAVVRAIRSARPAARVETLISDAKGDDASLQLLFDAEPDVMNHNIETVARLQRAVRPSAGYARSLSVLARAKLAGLTTKSGLIVGMGERDDEVTGCLADLAGVGVDIVTIGQYLRPTSHHLPVARWVEPAVFDEWKRIGESLGIGHVEASPLTRSSYHAKRAAEHVMPVALTTAR
jgi:lipoic acid synthetase